MLQKQRQITDVDKEKLYPSLLFVSYLSLLIVTYFERLTVGLLKIEINGI